MEQPGDAPSLSTALDAITEKGRCGTVVYRAVLSLAEGDARNLGLHRRDAWNEMIQAQIPIIAEGMNIPQHRMGWLAAIHFEVGHPHAHLMFWDEQQGIRSYYTQPGRVDRIRIALTRSIFHDRLQELYAQKNQAERGLVGNLRSDIGGSILSVRTLAPHLEPMAEALRNLADRLPATGRLAYGSMPEPVRNDLDRLTRDLIQRNAQCRSIYARYLDLAGQIASLYGQQPQRHQDARTAAERRILKTAGNLLLRTARDMRRQNQAQWAPEAHFGAIQSLFMEVFMLLSDLLKHDERSHSLRLGELSKQAQKERALERRFEGIDWER